MMEWVRKTFTAETGLDIVFALLTAKVALAILRSLKERTFQWKLIPEFILDDIVPYGTGLLLLYALSVFSIGMAPYFAVAVGAVSVMLSDQVWTHLKALFGVKKPE